MSLWRVKRRQDINRRFGEQADDALLAIAILENRSRDIELDRDPGDLREMLHTGRMLLNEIQEALEAPGKADDHHYALAQRVANRWKLVSDDASRKLERNQAALEKAERQLTYFDELDDVKQTLELIEETASRTSKEEASRMENYFAG